MVVDSFPRLNEFVDDWTTHYDKEVHGTKLLYLPFVRLDRLLDHMFFVLIDITTLYVQA